MPRNRSLLTVLLLVVAGAVAFSSLRASGAQLPRTYPPQAASVATNREAAQSGGAIPTPMAADPIDTITPPTVVASKTLPSPPRLAPRVNEVGQVLVLEYHVFTTDPAQEGPWVRTIDDFRADLEWLYEHDFSVVPMRDVFLNRIAAPRGKHPVVLTFDDGTAGQFRFLPQPDGTLRVDPNSAVGVMEEMFAAHPDFGRGGYFAVLPFNCFHVPDEPDQTPYCDAKLHWLEAHGYEVGNHTAGHTDLHDVDDDTFKSTIGDAIDWVLTTGSISSSDILTLPFGNFPDAKKHPQQLQWLEKGFDYKGRQVRLLGALMVGGGPAPSPVSVLWDPMQVPRIQVNDDVFAHWQEYAEANEDLLYTSDGDPDTITVLRDEPPQLQGAFNPDQAAGRRIVVS